MVGTCECGNEPSGSIAKDLLASLDGLSSMELG